MDITRPTILVAKYNYDFIIKNDELIQNYKWCMKLMINIITMFVSIINHSITITWITWLCNPQLLFMCRYMIRDHRFVIYHQGFWVLSSTNKAFESLIELSVPHHFLIEETELWMDHVPSKYMWWYPFMIQKNRLNN